MSDLTRKIKAGGNRGSLCEEHGSILNKRRENCRCICPFHPYRDPSFVIYTKSHNYHRVSQGGVHGGVIDFIQHEQDRPSNDALAVLAARLGLMVHPVRQATTID